MFLKEQRTLLLLLLLLLYIYTCFIGGNLHNLVSWMICQTVRKKYRVFFITRLSTAQQAALCHYARGEQIFQESMSPLRIPAARKVTWNKVHTRAQQILGAIIQTDLPRQPGACNFCTPATWSNNVICSIENSLVIKKIRCIKCSYMCDTHIDPGCFCLNNISEIKLQLNKGHKLLLQIWYVPWYNVCSVSIVNYSEWNLTQSFLYSHHELDYIETGHINIQHLSFGCWDLMILLKWQISEHTFNSKYLSRISFWCWLVVSIDTTVEITYELWHKLKWQFINDKKHGQFVINNLNICKIKSFI